MKYVLEKMMLNDDFKSIVNETKKEFFIADYEDYGEGGKKYFTENSDFMVILSFFQKEFFYVFHKCICQQLTLGTINNQVLDELKKITIDSFKCK